MGQMVEVDGNEMFIYSEGEGDHTIVFMSGYGTPEPILDFKPLWSKLSDDYRIVVIEKFGYGLVILLKRKDLLKQSCVRTEKHLISSVLKAHLSFVLIPCQV